VSRFRFFTALILALALANQAWAAMILSVTQEVNEETRPADILARYLPMADYLSDIVGTKVTLEYSQNLTEELQRTRTGSFAVLLGPAHVIGSAVRYGYEPVAVFPGSEKMVFVVRADSAIKSLEDLKGTRIALPGADSLATYLARGEFNAKGIHTKTYFEEVRNFRFHEVALYALGLGQYDVAIADVGVAEKWLATNKGRVIYETKPVPSLGIAVNTTLDKAVQQKIRDALLSPSVKRHSYAQVASLGITELKPITKDDYSYVSTLGYFTPTLIQGVKSVTAEQAQDLMAKGVPFYDVRDAGEYKEMHVKGAISVPYKEKSSKEIGFDMSKDDFRIADAVKDKNAPLIFACNGGECWKSYKATVWAQKEGFRNIYWFRGGFPEWKAKKLPMEQG
jgi:ABC-type phosphate/phosphonate transport system substrate-binding protein/rhodanese-related sulfurtransferase